MSWFARSLTQGADRAAHDELQRVILGENAVPEDLGDEAYHISGEFDSVAFRRSNVVFSIKLEEEISSDFGPPDRTHLYNKSCDVGQILLIKLDREFAH
jgi:hypothetical protein